MEEWNDVLDKVVMSDPGQAEVAASITAKFASQGSGPVVAADDPLLNLTIEHEFYRTEQQQLDYDRQMLSYSSSLKLLDFSGVQYLERTRLIRGRYVRTEKNILLYCIG